MRWEEKSEIRDYNLEYLIINTLSLLVKSGCVYFQSFWVTVDSAVCLIVSLDMLCDKNEHFQNTGAACLSQIRAELQHRCEQRLIVLRFYSPPPVGCEICQLQNDVVWFIPKSILWLAIMLQTLNKQQGMVCFISAIALWCVIRRMKHDSRLSCVVMLQCGKVIVLSSDTEELTLFSLIRCKSEDKHSLFGTSLTLRGRKKKEVTICKFTGNWNQ